MGTAPVTGEAAHPRVSVIICVRNGARTLPRQLSALGAQQGAPAFEVVISDNGSTDSTRRIAQDWVDHLPAAVTSARVIDSGQRVGIPHARNEGARHARGPVLAFCDADDEVHPGWVAAWASHDGVRSGLAGGRVEAHHPDGTPAPGLGSNGLRATGYLPMVSGCNFAVAREVFVAVGGFDVSLPPYGCDDLEFSWRVQENGYPISYLPEARVAFTVSPRARLVRKTVLTATARMATAVRHPDSPDLRFGLAGCLRLLGRELLLLPGRMVRSAGVARTQHLRRLVIAVGYVRGAVVYRVLRRPPDYIAWGT